MASGTGQLTFAFTTGSVLAVTSGTAAYGEVCDVAGDSQLAMPAEAGTSAVSGKIVISTLTITSGVEVSITSATVG